MHTADLRRTVHVDTSAEACKVRSSAKCPERILKRPRCCYRLAHGCFARRSTILTLIACKAHATGSTVERPREVQQSTQQTDVVVIGSGIGGLCCAALLAKYGLKVGEP